MLTVRNDLLLCDENGTPQSAYIDSFTAGEAVHAGTSVILFRLWDSQVHPTKGAGAPTSLIPDQHAHQFRMSSTRARALAQLLLDAADLLDGQSAPRH